MRMKKYLSIPEKHQLRIAKDTLKLSDIGAKIMGGMTKDEAKKLLISLQINKIPDKELSQCINNLYL